VETKFLPKIRIAKAIEKYLRHFEIFKKNPEPESSHQLSIRIGYLKYKFRISTPKKQSLITWSYVDLNKYSKELICLLRSLATKGKPSISRRRAISYHLQDQEELLPILFLTYRGIIYNQFPNLRRRIS
jgi:hypothetical protein